MATVLVVDDEPHLEIVVRQIMRKDIRAGKYEFVFATTGEEALSVIADKDVDAVMTDINMPKISGLQLLEILREQHPMIGAVMITAYGDMENIRAAMNGGAYDFLTKPIDFADFKITLEKVLKRVTLLKQAHHERSRRFLAEKLCALTESLTSTLDLERVLDRFLANLRDVTPCIQAWICLDRPTDLHIAAQHGSAASDEQLDPDLLESLFEDISQTSNPITLSAAQHNSGNFHLLAAPLIRNNTCMGMVILAGEETFAPDQITLTFAMAGQAGIAIENARLFEQVHQMAITDSLTGLMNRRHFLELASREVQRGLRYGSQLSAIMLDIDHFKHFNDQHGHAVGDRVLKLIAETLKRECRTNDLLGRLGGDELAVLLLETDVGTAHEIATRLQRAVTTQELEVGESKVSLTISQGVAALQPGMSTVAALLHTADTQLLQAKNKGRNLIAVADKHHDM